MEDDQDRTDPGQPATESGAADAGQQASHKRRVRYSGTHPRKFQQKYKELQPEKYQDTVQKVLESGKTPAGTHRPIMVAQILEVLGPAPGHRVVDATLGWGGHTQELLQRVTPGGHVLGLDCDPVEMPRTEARLRELGFGPDVFTARRTNYAGILQSLAMMGWESADRVLADLGVSSMQLDDPTRGFSVKNKGPLDMRMNPNKGVSASVLLQRITPEELALMLVENSDEPNAELLGRVLAGRNYVLTTDLAATIRKALPKLDEDGRTMAVRRAFQALRIAVNDEFTSLDVLLRHLPLVLAPGGKVAILTFHSGEDRRVKKAFKDGLAAGLYEQIADEVVRASPEERRANPRSSSAKLRWAVKALS